MCTDFKNFNCKFYSSFTVSITAPAKLIDHSIGIVQLKSRKCKVYEKAITSIMSLDITHKNERITIKD